MLSKDWICISFYSRTEFAVGERFFSRWAWSCEGISSQWGSLKKITGFFFCNFCLTSVLAFCQQTYWWTSSRSLSMSGQLKIRRTLPKLQMHYRIYSNRKGFKIIVVLSGVCVFFLWQGGNRKNWRQYLNHFRLGRCDYVSSISHFSSDSFLQTTHQSWCNKSCPFTLNAFDIGSYIFRHYWGVVWYLILFLNFCFLSCKNW